MRYIRFLKTPLVVQEKCNPSKSHIYALITITSDLGDSFLPHDVTLSAELLSCSSSHEELVVWRTVQWTGGMRSLPIILPLSRTKPAWPLRVRVGMEAKSERDDFVKLYDAELRGVVSAWSAPLDLAKGEEEAAKLVERRIAACTGEVFRIWEETGESIARHLWDAGVTMSCHIRDILEKVNLARKSALRVMELGTGCGVVAISIAQCMAKAEVILTDLPEVEEIVSRNISQTLPKAGSGLTFWQLDWDGDLPQNLVVHGQAGTPHPALDLIVAADCTYNPDSSPALVKTLDSLAKCSPAVTILIAMKKRHSSEEVFFDLMRKSGFALMDTTSIPLPGDEESGEETVYVNHFRYGKDA
ncbi:uncharacterized protein EI97DRAFT_366958 [Westerdykella ornata]|uniref:Uncharacterized protein n=1 Tax=Westerdykella ornata TaxID=318751 RepID=A0A6A6JXQ8_WESOR|nr:uncharacterized protein EI97DRAFT_366958 [Westerdykella ornata]KAF2281005.1 hypothetical protein EI97DRAFT_366958 [Westerdykella ornata]